MNVPGLLFRMMLLSGAIGGLAGGFMRWAPSSATSRAFRPLWLRRIAVALLGARQCLGILLAAILFGALATSGATIQLFSDVPIEIVKHPAGPRDDLRGRPLQHLWKGRRA